MEPVTEKVIVKGSSITHARTGIEALVIGIWKNLGGQTIYNVKVGNLKASWNIASVTVQS